MKDTPSAPPAAGAPTVLLDVGGIAAFAPRPGTRVLPARKQSKRRWEVVPGDGSAVAVDRHDLVEVMKQDEKETRAAVRDVIAALIAAVLVESCEERARVAGACTRQQSEAVAGSDPPREREDTGEEEFLVHRVNRSDSLLSLSLRYGVPVPQIRRDNGVSAFNDSIRGYGELRIRRAPNAHRPLLAPPVDRKVLDLQTLMKATGLSKQESEYYMSIAEDDFDAALAEYKEDMEWEKANGKTSIAVFGVGQ
jgi:hypothetical protein